MVFTYLKYAVGVARLQSAEFGTKKNFGGRDMSFTIYSRG